MTLISPAAADQDTPVATSTREEKAAGIGERKRYHALNSQLNLYSPEGTLQLDKDHEAMLAYLDDEVTPKLINFPNPLARLQWLISNNYYERGVFDSYSDEFLESIYAHAHSVGHEFRSFVGAMKFFTSYALKSFDGTRYLETFPDRVVATALALAGGNEDFARELVDEMLSARFQPATPTFLNAGKAQRGEFVSCFLQRLEDNLESIAQGAANALQLSKRGGGVAILLTNLRELGAPIKNIENQASGVVPVMKIFEDIFSYANQLGARQGAGAVYLHAHHPDILRFLDTKRENADEKFRIKTLALGVVIPDITFELARDNKPMMLFSPYDVLKEYGIPLSDIGISAMYDTLCANPNIRKQEISARAFFKTLAELQFESGYPYVLFEDTVNRAHQLSGWINMSNLCSEILQRNTISTFAEDGSYSHVGEDISCNLGSLNIAQAMASADIARTVETAVRALTAVSDTSNIQAAPSVARGNYSSHAIGLGQMNLHGYLASQKIHYGSEEALDFTDIYFMLMAYHSVRASCALAKEREETFSGFEQSRYASGEYFDYYLSRSLLPKTARVRELFDAHTLPTVADWAQLKQDVATYGMYNAYLQAIPPTGSISYVNHSTSSIHPIAAQIEIRKEGKLGRVYYAAPHLSDENREFFADAYELGYEKIIDTYAAATPHVDQGLSLTLFFTDEATTRDINRAQIYAWKKGIKTLYYVRLRQPALEGTQIEGCVSCAL
ncbi:class 1b ribonucleoside-diphosphate reductase subunit alpha [Corynebacterium felinum]|uniref:Ribonucleoside-diphosphate reductase n=1 Tax=Corynebacterium felinum TaxID=131318 RepID=A0ABU2B6C7_9CORY|nr:class 1b ribonucleoside-diphosphate reductase subunit alpha [Corynebacterium felinum]MDF5820525.1 class 1b ribonucleoside-diphosphate reductase subunit alpha [Corynebacterium felinum]MDR7353564.1 ribonucleoside-diphosphate reductase alpha chain [Corynebacterium felinum]WJY95744.1 Ribonucleoside-diphosphate reductase 2 subunit alpha [Corynebacterium felinum]